MYLFLKLQRHQPLFSKYTGTWYTGTYYWYLHAHRKYLLLLPIHTKYLLVLVLPPIIDIYYLTYMYRYQYVYLVPTIYIYIPGTYIYLDDYRLWYTY